MRARSALLALSALAFASSLDAQESAPAGEDIVVNGTKPTKQAVARFVDSITRPVDNQIARFRNPICPASFGLPASYNAVVEQRIREDALRVGLRISGRDCDPNVVVLVADEPIPLVKALRRERPQMFVGLEFGQIEDVLRTKEPVRTWQAVEARGSDGRPLERVLFFNQTQIGGNGAWLNPAASNSRIQQNTQADLVASFVVIAANAVDGLTLTQIADYAAMRALASTRASPNVSGRTILALFNKVSAPSELTAWDLGYLRGLYRTNNGLAAHSQEAAITGVIRRELDSREP